MMNIFKRKAITPSTPQCPEPPKDGSIITLETYARNRLIYDMHILNNFLESLYKVSEFSFKTNFSKDEKWVKLCNNHIDSVKDVLNSNYGDGATKKCKYCDKVFKGYMAGAMLEYHKNSEHKKELEAELAISCACIGVVMVGMLNAMTSMIGNLNDSNHPPKNPEAPHDN